MSKKKIKHSFLVGLMLFLLGVFATPFLLSRSYINIVDYIQGPYLIKPNECTEHINRYVTLHEEVDFSKITYFREGFSLPFKYPKLYIAPLKNDPETWILISIPGTDSIKDTLNIYKNLQNPTGILRNISNLRKSRSNNASFFSKKDYITLGNIVNPITKKKILNRNKVLCIMILNSTPNFLRGLFLLLTTPLFILFAYGGTQIIINKFKRS